jgi:nucleotide-binding universal stress UspA family protein
MERPHYALGGLLSPLGPEEYRDFKEKEWGAVYEEAERRAPYGIRTEFELLHGDPAEELAKAAEHVDLLLVGSRGYGPVKGALLGSVSARLMSSAACPLIVVARGAGSHPLED